MKTIYVLTGALVVSTILAGCVVAPATYPARTAAVVSNPLAVEDIKSLSKAGVNDDTIISQIKATRTVYHLMAAQIIDLKNEGISQKVIDCMINTALDQASPEAATVGTTSSRGYYYVEPSVSYDYYYTAPYPYVEYYGPPFPLFWPHEGPRYDRNHHPQPDNRPHVDNSPRRDNRPPGKNQPQVVNQPQGQSQPQVRSQPQVKSPPHKESKSSK